MLCFYGEFREIKKLFLNSCHIIMPQFNITMKNCEFPAIISNICFLEKSNAILLFVILKWEVSLKLIIASSASRMC